MSWIWKEKRSKLNKEVPVKVTVSRDSDMDTTQHLNLHFDIEATFPKDLDVVEALCSMNLDLKVQGGLEVKDVKLTHIEFLDER